VLDDAQVQRVEPHIIPVSCSIDDFCAARTCMPEHKQQPIPETTA
jgi:hypothetical protein